MLGALGDVGGLSCTCTRVAYTAAEQILRHTPFLNMKLPSRSNHTLIFHDPQTIIFLPQTDERARECRAQRQVMKMHSIMGIIALALCSVLFLNSIQPSVPDVVDHDFGVAFDLTSPYG